MLIWTELAIQIIFLSKKIFEIHLGDLLNNFSYNCKNLSSDLQKKRKKKDKIEDKNKSDSNNQNLAPF